MYTKDHLNSAKMDLTENSRIVLEKRYLRKNSDGEIIETPEKMFENGDLVVTKRIFLLFLFININN